MSFQLFLKRVSVIASFSLGFFATCAVSQVPFAPRPSATPTLIVSKLPQNTRLAHGNNLYCAGYVQTTPVKTESKIIGAHDEQEQFLYSQNNFVYINAGENNGVKVGDLMTVFRPRGSVKTRWTKKGNLGFYVQEVGALEVVRVKSDHSVALVKTSCDNLLLGDLVEPAKERMSPVSQTRPPLDLFADPSGKAVGRLFMARDNQELLGREQIVYIDLGAEDNVRVGDYLTIFRPLGKAPLVRATEGEAAESTVLDFESNEFRGGKFSNRAPRTSGETAGGSSVSIEKAKNGRPSNLRKVVGEMVVLNVKERTATAIITRTAQEIHTGDYVEVQ